MYSRAATNARVLETVENYALAEVKGGSRADWRGHEDFGSDEQLWHSTLAGKLPFGTTVDFPQGAAVSEWIARVPGLFWTESAAKLRVFTDHDVERRTGESNVLRPFGKSRLVSGGVGTMRLPPSSSGDRLATLATSGNVSAGIPTLISDDVWRSACLHEGSVVQFRGARWEPMEESWASRFPSTRGIPRAYLRLDCPQAVDSLNQFAATEIHPFSIMEYASKNVELFDFVFATAVTADPLFRREVEDFFEDYKKAEGRNGRYLIAADIAEPLWDSEFTSPEQLRSADPSAASYLRLLQRRIEDSMVGDDTTEYLLNVLTNTSPDLLKRFSAEVGIPHSIWFRGGTLA